MNLSMNPKIPKTTWNNCRTGYIPKTARSYSLYDANGKTIVHDKPYAYCFQVKKNYPNSKIKPNY